VSCRTVSAMSLRRTTASVATAFAAALLGSASAQAAFVPALGSPFPTGATTSALAVADADRNGTVDVAAGGLRLLRGDASGRLGAGVPIGSVGSARAVATGDLDGDGLRDYAAIVGDSPRRLLTFTAQPLGGYAEAEAWSDPDASSVAIANVDGDGLADLVVTVADNGADVTVLRNRGGTYIEDSYPSSLPAPADVAVGDLTGDGLPDLVVAGGGTAVSVLVNAVGGTFANGAPHPSGAAGSVERLVLGQFDGDGMLDVAATDSGGAPAVVLMRGNGAGGLLAAGRRPAGLPSAPTALDANDVNGDGASDVVVGAAEGRFSVLLGDAAAELRPTADSPFANGDPAGGTIDDIAAVDMNHDEQPDVVTANRPGSVSVLLNSATGLLSPSPGGIRFGEMPAGAPARGAVVTLRSLRGRLRISRVDLEGPRSFTVDGRGCVGRTLLLGQTCSLPVTYAPARRAGRQQALLSVDANAAAVVIPLGATPRAPIVTSVAVKPRKAKPGARLKLRYGLSEAARARVLVERSSTGRRADGECVPATRSTRRLERCVIWTTLATLARPRKARAAVLRPRARARGRKLAPGLYRFAVSATDRFRNRSAERTVKFRVVQAARRAK
jgi:FG-GAP-like repeat